MLKNKKRTNIKGKNNQTTQKIKELTVDRGELMVNNFLIFIN